MIFTSDVWVEVEVEVLDATPATAGRYADRPEACYPAEPEEITLAVRLGGLEITDHLPADVLEGLVVDARERLLDP